MIDDTLSEKELHLQAKEMEAKGNNSAAIELYKAILKKDTLSKDAWNALMKLYRRTKEYKKEATTITQAIKAYESYFKKYRPRHRKSVDDISHKLNRALGLIDKDSNALYSPEPVASWKKRRQVVEKKL